MNIARRLALFVASFCFGFFLFALVSTASLSRTIGRPSVVKDWLNKSGVYNKIVPAVLEQSTKNDQNEAAMTDSISLSDPTIQKIAEQTFTPTFVQHSSDSVIDGTYSWLQGKTAKPEFNIDIGAVKAQFANNVGSYLQQRAATLPLCKTIPAEVDLMTATCIPPGVNVNAEVQKTVNDIISNKDFLPDPNVTADNLKLAADQNTSSQPYYQKSPNLPASYRWMQWAPWIFGFLAIATGVAIVFLSRPRRQGDRKVMISLITTSILLFFYVWLISFALTKGQSELAKQTSSPKLDALKTSGFNLAHIADHDINHIIVAYCIAFLAVAVALAVYLYLTRDKSPKPPKNPEQTHFKRDESEPPSALH